MNEDSRAQGKEGGRGSTSEPSPPRKPFPTTIDGKLSTATDYKEEGNTHFKDGNYKKAVSSYAKVLAFVRGLPGSKRGLEGIGAMAADHGHAAVETVSVEQDQRAGELERVVLTNIATCYLKMKDPRKAMEYADKTLAINQSSWKALLRKAEAHIQMSNFENAKMVLLESLSFAPDSVAKSAIAKVRETLVAAEKAANEKQKEIFKKANIFGIQPKAPPPPPPQPSTGSSSSSSSSKSNGAAATSTSPEEGVSLYSEGKGGHGKG